MNGELMGHWTFSVPSIRMKQIQPLYCLIGLIFLMAGCSAPQSDTAGSRPNFLLIMSDNHYYSHLGTYGDSVVETPNIDRLADRGVQFTNAFCASPSCTPARSALLAGQDIWRLGQGANLWSTLSDTITTYVDLLEKSGYSVGHSGKGWGPGNFEAGGRKHNPAGYTFESFDEFMNGRDTDRPWSFWISSRNPHRPFTYGAGIESGMNPDSVDVPPYLPDVPEVRADMTDYYYQIQQFDKEVEEAIARLEESGDMGNTIIMVTADNGWMMPRGLANLYDFGTRIPLIITWPEQFEPSRKVGDLVNLNDLAPTMLQLAGIPVPEDFTARTLLPILESEEEGRIMEERDEVYMARERHAIARQEGLGYPGRAIRTYDYLLIHNMKPERWPAGEPPLFADIDAHMLQYESPTKEYMMAHNDDPEIRPLYEDAFLKRPEYELFDLREDPWQMNNVAGDPEYRQIEEELKERLRNYLEETGDPRVTGGEIIWDDQPYYWEDDWVGKPREEAQEKFGLKDRYPYRRESE